MVWRFRDYMSRSGRNPIGDWYKGLSPQAKADFDRLLQILERTREWREPAFKRLQGKKYRGLGELRWLTERVQYRVIGCNGPGRGEYTLLIGCTHKSQVYNPPNALDTAAQRMKSLQSGEGSTCEHKS
ncbi:MAG: type II toxin-antitoxin system RelE/ParE family toxin [Deltaproteobacteria bacterium]|nr:type II toxin-antitoxin system RelE/ParE family toxin [Deltaproteobacteria bacterium]